jgi:hypothetical protein
MMAEKEFLKIKARVVSECMLSQYFGTAAGLGIGLAVGIQKKSLRSFVIAITAGTLADWVFGYTGPCRTSIEDYKNAEKMFAEKRKSSGLSSKQR